MTKIRLARTGSSHQPHYRIVVTDSRNRRDGRFIEILGAYHPIQGGAVTIDQQRAAYWLSVGAQPSTTLIGVLTKGGIKHDFSVRRKPTRAAKNPVEAKAAPAVVATENIDVTQVAEPEASEEVLMEQPLSDEAAEASSEQSVSGIEAVESETIANSEVE